MFTMTFILSNKKPGPVTQLMTLIYPFEAKTWTMFIISCAFTYAAILLAKLNINSNVTSFQALSLSLSPVLREPMPTGTSYFWHHWYSKVVLNIWFLCGILLSYAYTCNLLANLVSVETEKPVDTFQDILEQGHMLTVLAGNSLIPFLATSKNKVIKKVYKVKTHLFVRTVRTALFRLLRTLIVLNSEGGCSQARRDLPQQTIQQLSSKKND